MKKVRVYSPFFPFPATEGALQVVADQSAALCAQECETELVIWKNAGAATWGPQDERFSVLSLQAPAPPPRLLRVLVSLTSGRSSPELHYYPLAARRELPQADLGIYHYSFAYPWLSTGRPNERLRAIVFHNLESELFEQRARVETNPVFAAIHRLNARKLRAHEAELSRLVDEIWFISPEDCARYVPAPGGRARVRVLGPGYPPALRDSRRRGYKERREHGKDRLVLGFIGALDFLPNAEGALWLIRELAPRIQSRGFAGEIHIAGRGAPRELLEATARFPFVKVLGFLPDAEEFWASLSFSAVPHFNGSGVRMKLLESLASGVPVLATRGAAARIAPSLAQGPGVRVSDSADEWADCLCSQRPFEARDAFSASPFPDALDSTRTYAFIKELLV